MNTMPKKSVWRYLPYFPANFFLGGFVKIWVHPWESVAHVNAIRHVCHRGKKVEGAGLINGQM